MTPRARIVGAARARALGVARARQAWTIARIELRRVFFAKRSLWVCALALLPAAIFFGHGLETKFRGDRLTQRGVTEAALLDSVGEGEAVDAVRARLGKPAEERWSTRSRRVRQHDVRAIDARETHARLGA